MFVCVDIETTGLNPKTDDIIEVAIVRFDHTGVLEEWSSLVNPGVAIPEFTERLTGINDEMVKDAPRLDELRETIEKQIGDLAIMGHFIFFDVNFLNHHGFDFKNAQLDSCQLTQVLLHKEPSYSLEVLTKKLNITQEDAHRALDDVKANIDLFFRLSEHIRALSDKEKELMEGVLTKSSWDWAPVVLEVLKTKKGSEDKLIEATQSKRNPSSEEHAELNKLTQDLVSPFLLEEVSHTYLDLLNYARDLTKTDKKHTDSNSSLLVIPDLTLFPSHEDSSILKHPNQYISEDRLTRYLDKDKLDITETMIGLKTLLWIQSSQHGERSEIRLVKEEKNAWQDICCQVQDEPESFYKKALENAKGKPVSVISQDYFLRDRSRKIPQLKLPKHVIVSHCEQFVKQIEYSWHIQLSESRFLNDLHRLKQENPDYEDNITALASKISILFGFFGMFLQRHGEANSFKHTLVVEPFHRNTLEWNKVQQSAQSIEAAIASLGDDIKQTPTRDEFERYLYYLNLIVQSSGPVLWMTLSSNQQPIIHSFPEQSSQLFSKRVWKDIDQLHLFCQHGNLNDDFSFLKHELGLPEDIQCSSSKDILPVPLITPETPLSSPNDPRNLKEVCREMKKQLKDVKGNVMLLVTSKNAAEQFFYQLPKVLEDKNRKLFVQNLGGGMGKLFKMSQETDGNNFYVGNESFMNFLLAEGVDLRFLAVHRLPFSHPNDPIQKARASKYKDAYKEFSRPQASLNFQGLLNRFLGNQWEGKKILVLDPRLETVF